MRLTAAARMIPCRDLGTNDERAINKIDPKNTGTGMAKFAQETLQFMLNATKLYGKTDIQFFLNAGPMENTTITGTQSAIKMALAAGLKATFVPAPYNIMSIIIRLCQSLYVEAVCKYLCGHVTGRHADRVC
jgi:hypothetical protein